MTVLGGVAACGATGASAIQAAATSALACFRRNDMVYLRLGMTALHRQSRRALGTMLHKRRPCVRI
ncbi:hypothetical protein GCM10027081_16430 [Cupriavidus yeoncheonensis]